MRDVHQITDILRSLDERIADEFEGQDLDFKRWPSSMKDALDQLVAAAVCMANGSGGTIVFGVADKVTGRKNAILGIPPEVDINILLKAVFDRTSPTIR